jgi:TolB-like protein
VHAVFLLAVAGAGLSFLRTSSGGAAIDSIAVLPLVNVGGSADAEYLSDGITESLINSLSRLQSLKVMSRGSVFGYKGQEVDARAVGSALGVRAVLMGRVTRRGDGVDVSVELVDARDSSHLWGEQYDRKLTDLVSLQSEIARDVSRKLRTRLSGADEQRLARNYTENSEAYQLYLRGRYHLLKHTQSEIQTGIAYFRQAMRRWTGCGRLWSSTRTSGSPGSTPRAPISRRGCSRRPS